jgi:RHS repeat-associated protein
VVDGTALDVTTQRHGKVWFPTSPESLQYDEDGNLAQDGRWNYAWNAENRLIRAETRADVATATGMPRLRLDMAYDGMGRRIRKVVQSFSSTDQAWQMKSDLRFLYEGMSWNLIAEIEMSPNLSVSSSPRLVRAYAWGTDVSGTMTGAGGVGGLVLVEQSTINSQPSTSVLAPCYDGNGNISAYGSVQSGTVSSRHDYDVFGRPVWSELEGTGGRQVAASPFGFSTKYTDAETGWCYYGYRYYSPELGRFLSSDPIEEQGGISLYGFVGNDPVNKWDYLGLRWTEQDENRNHPPSDVDRAQRDVEQGKRRTVDWFKSWFPHRIQKNLIEHYAYGNGQKFTLSEADMGLIKGDINLYGSAEFRQKVTNLKQATTLTNFEAKGFVSVMQGTLGQK